jgi:hypothetical protein
MAVPFAFIILIKPLNCEEQGDKPKVDIQGTFSQ